MLTSVALFAAALSCWREGDRAAQGILVFLDGEGLEVSRAEEILAEQKQRENPAALCFWAEHLDVSYVCKQTGREARADEIVMAGMPELVVDQGNSLSWNAGGCLVDAQTARALFGTEASGGQTLVRSGKEREAAEGDIAPVDGASSQSLTALGVHQGKRPCVFRMARTASSDRLNRIFLRFARANNRRGQAEQILMQMGLSGEIGDLQTLSFFVFLLCLLCPIRLLSELCRLLACLIDENRSVFLEKLGKLFTLLFWMAGVLSLVRMARIPEKMLPSRWSDFSFWPAWLRAQEENLARIVRDCRSGFLSGSLRQLLEAALLAFSSVWALPSFGRTASHIRHRRSR